jgi:hypothetical protein
VFLNFYYFHSIYFSTAQYFFFFQLTSHLYEKMQYVQWNKDEIKPDTNEKVWLKITELAITL